MNRQVFRKCRICALLKLIESLWTWSGKMVNSSNVSAIWDMNLKWVHLLSLRWWLQACPFTLQGFPISSPFLVLWHWENIHLTLKFNNELSRINSYTGQSKVAELLFQIFMYFMHMHMHMLQFLERKDYNQGRNEYWNPDILHIALCKGKTAESNSGCPNVLRVPTCLSSHLNIL